MEPEIVIKVDRIDDSDYLGVDQGIVDSENYFIYMMRKFMQCYNR